MGQVIPGWDEGFDVIERMAQKALIFASIPFRFGESLEPGWNEVGPRASEILVFDVEVTRLYQICVRLTKKICEYAKTQTSKALFFLIFLFQCFSFIPAID